MRKREKEGKGKLDRISRQGGRKGGKEKELKAKVEREKRGKEKWE